jgi:formate hydrogenlyase subunit 6/NADH:ubiquinone oxidoreductase subunit I
MASEIPHEKTWIAFGKFTRRQLMELDTCEHCALCSMKCPAYAESREPNHTPGARSSKTVKLITGSSTSSLGFSGHAP